jgi:hypothetical protein
VPDEKKPAAQLPGATGPRLGEEGRKSPGQIAIGADYKHLVSFGKRLKGICFSNRPSFAKNQSA